MRWVGRQADESRPELGNGPHRPGSSSAVGPSMSTASLCPIAPPAAISHPQHTRGHLPQSMSGLIAAIEHYPQRAFAAFLALHIVVWTALPALLYPNLPLDLIEALTYGREWQLGYDKLPPLP